MLTPSQITRIAQISPLANNGDAEAALELQCIFAKKHYQPLTTIHYWFGKNVETYRIETSNEERVSAFVEAFFATDRTKSKDAMFEALFANVWFGKRLVNGDWFEYSIDSVKQNWSIYRMIEYVAKDIDDWNGPAEAFFDSCAKWLAARPDLSHLENILREDLNYTDEHFKEIRKA